jgi:uncharacterized protein (TIGR02996 family)
LEKYPQAIAYFTELKTMNAENAARAESYIIDTYRAAKQLDKALAASEDAVKAHPEDKDLKLLHADLLSESGKGAQAIERSAKNAGRFRGRREDLFRDDPDLPTGQEIQGRREDASDGREVL